jgi:DNA-binding GntR family transcriptional regulator
MQEHGRMAFVIEPEKPKLADWAYDELRRYIIDGVLPPGTRLVENKLTESLGISRTPLREALRRLEQDGLIARHLGGGLRVTELTMEELHEIMGIRALLEGYCASLAADRITADALAQLFQAHQDAAEAIRTNDLGALTEANTRFHDGINEAARAPRCLAMINDIRESVLRYRSEVLTDETARDDSFDQHAELLAALQSRDSGRIETLMRDHISAVEKHLTSTRRSQS